MTSMGKRNGVGFSLVARYDVLQRGHDVLIEFDGTVATGINFKKKAEGVVIEPTLSAAFGGTDFLQNALDCAWGAGLRPTGFVDSEPTGKAKDRHLEDMRAIAFHGLGVAKP